MIWRRLVEWLVMVPLWSHSDQYLQCGRVQSLEIWGPVVGVGVEGWYLSLEVTSMS